MARILPASRPPGTRIWAIADEEGRQLQAVIEEALREYVERKRGERPREQVLTYLQASVERHRDLYRRLAE